MVVVVPQLNCIYKNREEKIGPVGHSLLTLVLDINGVKNVLFVSLVTSF